MWRLVAMVDCGECEPARISHQLLLSPTLIDMANDRQWTAKESKGFRNQLKKTFRLGSQSVPSAAPVDAAPPPVINPVEAVKLRARYTHFRVLIVGRANAGKTSLLHRVCNTKEDPVYNTVRYQPCLIPQAYRSFTDRLTQPPRSVIFSVGNTIDCEKQ